MEHPSNLGSSKRRISGSTGLKDSQVYPPEYGHQVFRQWQPTFHALLAKLHEEGEDMAEDDINWESWLAAVKESHFKEAGLEELAAFLNLPLNKFLH